MRRPLIVVLTIALALGVRAADWPQHLGPERNGVGAVGEAPFPETFEGDLEVLWEKDLGTGFAGPVIAGGLALIFHREGDEAALDAVDPLNGRSKWRYAYRTDYVDSFGFDNGPRAIPTVQEGTVYLHGADGQVHAVNLADGRRVWSYDTVSELGSGQGYFGRVGAPLIAGELVVIPAGGELEGKPAGMVALDRKNGSVRWTGVDDEAGYSSPVLDGFGHIVAWMRNRLWIVDAASGEVRDSVHFRSDMDASVNACTPLVLERNRIFTSAGYGVGAGLWEVSEAGKLTEVWIRHDWMDCHYGTPVEFEGHLYGFDGRQETGQTLRCVGLNSGKRLWDSDRLPGGTLLRVGSKVVVVTEQGELWIVPASPNRFDPIHRQQLFRSGHRSHPAYADGILYARDSEKLVAVRLSP